MHEHELLWRTNKNKRRSASRVMELYVEDTHIQLLAEFTNIYLPKNKGWQRRCVQREY